MWADLYGATNNLNTRYLRGDAIDELFARIEPGDITSWTLTDRMLSVRDVIINDGTVKNTLVYDGFGKIISESDHMWRGRYAWTGRELDVETNLQYNRARYYDSNIGKWTSQDPLGFGAGDSNLYRYSVNRAVTNTDPSGLQQPEFIGPGQGFGAELTGKKSGLWDFPPDFKVFGPNVGLGRRQQRAPRITVTDSGKGVKNHEKTALGFKIDHKAQEVRWGFRVDVVAGDANSIKNVKMRQEVFSLTSVWYKNDNRWHSLLKDKKFPDPDGKYLEKKDDDLNPWKNWKDGTAVDRVTLDKSHRPNLYHINGTPSQALKTSPLNTELVKNRFSWSDLPGIGPSVFADATAIKARLYMTFRITADAGKGKVKTAVFSIRIGIDRNNSGKWVDSKTAPSKSWPILPKTW